MPQPSVVIPSPQNAAAPVPEARRLPAVVYTLLDDVPAEYQGTTRMRYLVKKINALPRAVRQAMRDLFDGFVRRMLKCSLAPKSIFVPRVQLPSLPWKLKYSKLPIFWDVPVSCLPLLLREE